MVQFKAFISYF